MSFTTVNYKQEEAINGEYHYRNRSDPQGCQPQSLWLNLPLITKNDGTKFGKTEGGSLADPARTTPHQFTSLVQYG